MDTISHASAPREVSRQQHAWLRTEVVGWRDAGIIDDVQAAAISDRYRPVSGSAASVLGRIMLLLGGGFVGVGLIWLVAANLDDLSPTARFVTVAALWLAVLIGGEVLAARRASAPLVGGIRLLAALGFGALIMQAAQSLQVPAYEPMLVGLWSLGAMLHAHLTRSVMPFLVGLGTGIQWWIWQPLWTDGTAMMGAVLSLGAGAIVAASLAVLCDGWARSFAWWWRLTAAALALAALFVAAIPGLYDGFDWSLWLGLELGAALVLTAAAVALTVRRSDRAWIEPVGALAVLIVAALLALWDVDTDVRDVGFDQWAHAALSIIAYVALAVGLLALDVLRQHRAISWIAMAALVTFTTFQSFAVFVPIVTGAWLFVVLGVVFLGTGTLVDRARRRVARSLDPVTGQGTDEGAQR
ncbi:DUF2157 domain-containing protein [Janibacter alittae]|uniref:DUF2157 domain-containing protein n=1 Tax=Janibacter alittae TaxID=3115209 RepID=A0ABZ2MJL5_9MICO